MQLTKQQVEGARITTVKILKGKYIIKFLHGSNTINFEGKEAPTQELINAMKSMTSHGVSVLPISEAEKINLAEKASIKGVNIQYKGDKYQGMIIVEVKNENDKSIPYNTPYMPVAVNTSEYKNSAEIPAHWSEEAHDAFEDLLAEAKAYLCGVRSQTKLFNPDSEEDEDIDEPEGETEDDVAAAEAAAEAAENVF